MHRSQELKNIMLPAVVLTAAIIGVNFGSCLRTKEKQNLSTINTSVMFSTE